MSHNHKPNGRPHQPPSSHSRSDAHRNHDHHHRESAAVQVDDTVADARRISKGKQRAEPLRVDSPAGKPGPHGQHERIAAQLDEAIHTSLSPPSISSSLESTFAKDSPISHLPQAHYPAPLRPHNPRLLSQLTRTTLPTASMTYASQSERRNTYERSRAASESGEGPSAESSMAWQRSLPTTALSEEPFPDLDPTTGLPLEISPSRRRNSTSSEAPSLHLQRTITDILSASTQKPVSASSSMLPSFPSMSMLSLPRVSLPSKPSFDFGRRNLSSTAPQDDWGNWATGWWGGNKKQVDGMMSEEDKADTVEEEQEKLRKKYRTPKNPVVFCHGLLGFDYLGPSSLPPLQISHWRGIREVLESNGVEVLIARVPATSSIKDRATILAEVIAEKYPGREVNLIGHSMGGLDCRYLISEIKPKAFKIVSLTTISTPHRGSPFADYIIDNVIGRERLPSLIGLLEAMRLPQSGDGTAFSALRTSAMKEFNAEVVDQEDVSYYSWGASFEPGLLDTFKWPHSVILAKEGPNDGLVSVHSAMWGEYRGTLVGVNHLDLVGWVNTVRYVMAGWTGKPIAFKPATFYLEVADYLAEQQF